MNPRKDSCSKFEWNVNKMRISLSPLCDNHIEVWLLFFFNQMNFFYQIYLPSPILPHLLHHPETLLSALSFPPEWLPTCDFTYLPVKLKWRGTERHFPVSTSFPPLSPHCGRAWWKDLYILLSFQIPPPEKTADVGCSPHLHKNAGLKK